LTQPEIVNIQFPVIVTTNRRIQIPKSIFKAAKLQQGDTVILVLAQIYRKNGEKKKETSIRGK